MKISFRPGPLATPLKDFCDVYGISPSKAIRKALAKMLREDEPEMNGNGAFITEMNKKRARGNSEGSNE